MAKALGEWVLALDRTEIPDKAVIGGKAWSIASMSALGLNVPPAFVIGTHACVSYLSNGALPATLQREIDDGIAWLEQRCGRQFGGGPRPLLVSVRSGAAVSMPGMMDTVLNLGVNEETEALLAAEWQDSEFARDIHRRFLDLYARIVLRIAAPELNRDAEPAAWRCAISGAGAGAGVPTDARAQIFAAVRAVFDSWNSPRARRYRQHQGISDALGTAVTVQAMVFGNLDDQSGTGVVFSRNPMTGDSRPYGEFLARAQGEEIVSGSHTPVALEAMRELTSGALDELLRAARELEAFHGDVQDIEFTVERGQLYFLQTRSAKRSPQAAVCVAVAMVNEGHISAAAALRRVSPEQVRILLRPQLADGAALGATIVARGEGASPGIGRGIVSADAQDAEMRTKQGEEVVLARATTSPNDLHGMIAAQATITELGGGTSHAAVVARALGKPCVVGCGAGSLQHLAGQHVTVDGGQGVVYRGSLLMAVRQEESDPALQQLIEWASERAPIKVVNHAPAACSVIDVDELLARDESTAIADALSGVPRGSCVRGHVFASNDEAVRAAVHAGIDTIVTYPRLPPLLVAVQMPAAKT